MQMGYTRFSSENLVPELLRDLLLADDCKQAFEEEISSREAEKAAVRGLSSTVGRRAFW
jgi:hypothetical protein